MEMGDGFATVRPVIHHDAVAVFVESFLPCGSGCGQEESAEECGIVRRGLIETRDAAFWHDKKMSRGLGRDVAEGDPVFPFGDDLGGNFPGSDLLEECHREKG